MLLRHELTYDAAADDVYAMLADPAFREAVAAAQDVRRVEVTVTPTADGGLTVVNDQDQDTAGLPAIAKKIAGETTRAVITETWTGQRTATISIDVPGKPSSATGTLALAESNGTTVETVEIEIKVKVPMIGGKLENLMAEQITHGYDVEHGVGQAWLRGER